MCLHTTFNVVYLLYKINIGGIKINKEIVKYHNKINDIALRKLTDKELNIFFTVLYKLKDEGIKSVEINFIELKKLAAGDVNNPRFLNAIRNLNNKLLDLRQEITDEDGVILQFNLFNNFKIDPNKKLLSVEINKNFSFLLNELVGNFTKFELKQIVSFKSSYSKNMYRLLKQFETTKFKIILLEDLKRILCVPDSYKMSDIDKVVLKPIIAELSPVFTNLKIEKIKKGRSVEKLKFTWDRKIKDAEVIEIKISEELNKAIEKAKKNRFIQPFLTVDNLEKLIKKYTEEELVKGLNIAQKNIVQEIKSLNYIIKIIDNSLEEANKKIVVETAEPKESQGVEAKAEVKEELREETRGPELTEFKLQILESAKNDKNIDYFKFMSELSGISSLENLYKLIIKYEIKI